MSKYKKPKVGFLDHAAGKTDKSNPIDDVLKEAKENPAPKPQPKVETKKPVITEEKKTPAGGMSSYVKATQVDPNSAKGAFDDKTVEGYVPPILEEKKPEVDPQKMSAYKKAVHERSVKENQKIREAADLLGGEIEKPVTQADLKQIKVSLASLGGGGLGEKDVVELIREYGADSITDILTPDQIQQIIDAFRQLDDTDSLPEGLSNLYYTDARVDSNFALKTTDDLTEGSTNLYYTDSRARHAIQSIDSAIQYDQATGNIALNTDYIDTYNSHDFDSDFALKTTDSLSEGVINLYYTDSRARASIQSIDSSLIYDSTTGNLSLAIDPDDFYTTLDFDSDFALKSTDSLSEGVVNLYYTDSRARSAIQSIDSSLIYDSTTGNLSLAIDPDDFYTTVDFDSDFLTKTTDSLAEGTNNLYFQEERVQHMFYWAKAIEDIALGDVVQFAGAQGGHLLIRKADQTIAGFETHHVMGVAKEAILDQQFGYVAAFGQVKHIDVGTFSNGDILYLDPTTPGGFTDSKPAPPEEAVQIAAVTDDNPSNNGTIQVRLNHLPDTDEVPEGLTNLYWTQARFDSAFDSTGIRALHDSLSSRVDSDDIEIQTLKNRVDDLDLQSAIVLNFDKQLAYDSATDSLDAGNYAIHFTGGGTDYLSVDKLFFNHIDKNGNYSPMSVIDSGDIILLQDSDGGVARYIVSAYDDRSNHHEFDVTVEVASGAPADQILVKAYPEQNLGDLATYNYVDAQDKLLQDQIDDLDSALDSEHAWNVAEHSKVDSDLSSRFDSEHAWNVEEHRLLDSEFSAKMDSEHAWNVAEHSALDSDLKRKVNKSGDTMTGTLEFGRSLDTIFKIDPDSGTTSQINLFRGGNNNLTYLDNRLLGATYRNVLRWVGGTGASTEIMKMPSDASGVTINRLIVDGRTQLNDDLTVDADVTISNAGNLQVDSGNITATLGNIETTNGNISTELGNIRSSQGFVQTNTLKSVGNSNMSIQRNSTTKIQITSNANRQFQKAVYNTNYGVTDDLDIPHKLYVDNSIDSAIANASFEIDSDQFVNVTGDSMTGELSISRLSEHNVALRIKKGTQNRLYLRSDGLINWTGDATDARLNTTNGDLSISIDDDTYLKFDQSQGDIEVAKTLVLTGSEKAINLPNNADTGQLQSNGNRRLYWDKDNVSIDVPLQMVDQIKLKNTQNGAIYAPGGATSKITFENTKSDGTTTASHIFQAGTDNALVTNAKFKTKSSLIVRDYIYGWNGENEYVYSPRIRLERWTGSLKYGAAQALLWNEHGVAFNKLRGDGASGDGFRILGAIGDNYSATDVTDENGKILEVYHNANATDAVNYYGRITSGNNIVTKEYVDAQVVGGGGGGPSNFGRKFIYSSAYSGWQIGGVFSYTGGELNMNKMDEDGFKMWHQEYEFTWSSELKFTIRDPDGKLMVAGELEPRTNYNSLGLRFYVKRQLKFAGLAENRAYHITVEGYF